jgi:hypothetical protein
MMAFRPKLKVICEKSNVVVFDGNITIYFKFINTAGCPM